jgi:nicotinamide-nucleotide amidase
MSNRLFDEKRLELIRRSLLKRNETLSVAESVSAGLLQAAISQAESAIEFFQGGITTYNLGQKFKHLKVEPIQAEKVNCVSEKVTAQMALQVNELFGSDWGVAVTGYATPVPESGNNVFAFYAIAHHQKIVAKGKLVPGKDEPFELQLKYVNEILRFLATKLR